MKIYEKIKNSKQLIEETEYVKIYKCSFDNKEYKIVITKKRANRHTIIHCVNDCISWEQVPRVPLLAGRMYGDRVTIYKFNQDKKGGIIFIVRGKPNGITGLDSGFFRCADRFDDNYINVMSYRRFKFL